MPIKPENKERYPANWNDISAKVREEAGNKCEVCGVSNHAIGNRDAEGEFIPVAGNAMYDCYGQGLDYPSLQMLPYKKAREIVDWNNLHDECGVRYIVIVLTVAHLDHNPENCERSNLKAMCQRCHNRYDREHRNQTRRETKMAGQLELF